MAEYLTLKWGTLKGWNIESEDTLAILNRWAELGYSMSAMMQRDTDEQKKIICELIDAIDGPIENDWTGKEMMKEEAKEYVLNYDR